MAKKNGSMQGVSPQPSGAAPTPPQGGTGVVPASFAQDRATAMEPLCRCGGALSRGTMPDGTPALARVAMVPETLPQGLSMPGGPVLDAAMLICMTCRRVELVWSGR